MRGQPTDAEAILWEALRGRRLDGHKFRRQHPIGGFIADFCCPTARLVVEVDGGVHLARREADAARDERLRALGYRVVRIANRDVIEDLDGALAAIRHALRR